MGEIADMMLDGTLCMHCGVAMVHGPDDVAAGYPVSCGCQDDGDEPTEDEISARTCHLCGKRCKSEDGVLDHLNAKHPGWNEEPETGDDDQLLDALIGAVPDLLGALVQLMTAYGVELGHYPHPPHSERHKAWAAAGEAIAKASGREA